MREKQMKENQSVDIAHRPVSAPNIRPSPN